MWSALDPRFKKKPTWCFHIADTIDLRFVTINTSDCLFAVKAEPANMDQPILTSVSSAFDPEALRVHIWNIFIRQTYPAFEIPYYVWLKKTSRL